MLIKCPPYVGVNVLLVHIVHNWYGLGQVYNVSPIIINLSHRKPIVKKPILMANSMKPNCTQPNFMNYVYFF